MSGYPGSVSAGTGAASTHVARTLEKSEAKLDYHVIFVSENFGDLACNPSGPSVSGRCRGGVAGLLLHDLDIDLLHVDLLVELRRELRLRAQLLIHRCRHIGCFLCRANSSCSLLDSLAENVAKLPATFCCASDGVVIGIPARLGYKLRCWVHS